MRGFALVGLVLAAVLVGCGPEAVGEEETQVQGAPESWCNSYKSQQFCPKNVCFWDSSKPLCTTKAVSMDTKERWCNSYKTQAYCPKNVCVWNPQKNPSCTLPDASAMAGEDVTASSELPSGPCEAFTSPKTCPSSYCAWYRSANRCGPYVR